MRDSRLFDSVVGTASDFDDVESVPFAEASLTGDPWRTAEAESEAARPDPRIGQRIGHIRLDALAGRGGMGTVYEGWDDKLHRKVAVKAVSHHYRGSASARARFLHEARLLSKIQHPNICQIHEHIEGPDGDFLVLELIRGRSLRRMLEEKDKLDHGEGLRIAHQLVDALVAAHDRSIAHRDLKPANIMITDDGTVKVLDFGLALSVERAMEKGKVRAGLSWTGSGVVKQQGAPIRSADARPIALPGLGGSMRNSTAVSAAEGNGSSTIEGTLGYMSPEQARSEPAGTASDIYSLGLVLQEMFTGAPAYPTDLPLTYQLAKVGRGETLPVTGVDPDLAPLIERMTSVASGSRPSALDIAERLDSIAKKPARRARRIAVAAFIALLTAFAAVMAFQRVRISEEASRANLEAEAARQVSEFLVGLFEVSDPWNAEAADITARELLNRGARRIRGELEDQPRTRARLLVTIGDVHRRLGFYDDARTMLEEALELRRQHGAEPAELATGLTLLAQLDSDQGHYDQALERFRAAVALRRTALGPDHPELAEAIYLLGYLKYRRGDYESAIEDFDEALEIRERVFGPRSEPVAEVHCGQGLCYGELGRLDLAEELHSRVLEIREEILPGTHPLVGVSIANLAALYLDKGEFARALPLFERELDIATAAFGPDHPDVAISHHNLGSVLRTLGRLSEAEPHAIRSLAIRQEALGEEHPSVGAGLHELASTYREMGRADEAEALYLRSLEIWRAAYGEDHPYVAASLSNRANLYATVGRHDEAVPLFVDALSRRVEHFGPDHLYTAHSRTELAFGLISWSDRAEKELTEAERQLHLAMTAVEALLQQDPGLQAARHVLGRSLQGLAAVEEQRHGRTSEADELLGRARMALEPLATETESVRYEISFVELLLDMGLDDEAKPLARDLLRRGIGRQDLVDACDRRGWTA